MRSFRILFLLVLIFNMYSAFAQWQVINSGTTKKLVDGCFVNDSVGIIISSDGFILKTDDQGNTWNPMATLTGGFTSLCNAGTDTIYAGGDCIYRSDDQGDTWDQISSFGYTITDLGFFGSKNGFSVVPEYEYCSEWVITYKIGKFKFFKSTDFGVTWQLLYDDLDEKSRIQVINDSTGIYYGGSYLNVPKCFMGYMNSSKRTTDRGNSWTYTLQPDGPGSLFSYINQDTGYIIDGRLSTMYKTIDGGNTFTGYYCEDQDTTVKQIKFLNEIDGYLLANNHIYITSSNGLAWKNDFNSTEKLTMLFNNTDHCLFAVGDQGTILKKYIVESLHPDTIYRMNVDPMYLTFGTIPVNKTKIRYFGVANTGNIALNLSVTAPDGFLISFTDHSFTPTLSLVLNPSQSQVIYVQFHPQLEKIYSDSISIMTDSIEKYVPVNGRGLHILDSDIVRDTIICTDTLRIGSDITVNPGTRLTVCAGTFVQMMDNYKITVKGTIEALGDSLHPIEFGALKGWRGISLEHSNPNDTSVFNYCDIMLECETNTLLLQRSIAKINHCKISNLGGGYAAIRLYDAGSGLDIQNSDLFNIGEDGIECLETDSCFIKNCHFHDNVCGIDISNSVSKGRTVSHIIISDNILNNNDTGIRATGNISILGNEIFNNNDAGIDATGSISAIANMIYNNGTGMRILNGKAPLLVENNEVYNNRAKGVEIGFKEDDAYILQNLIYNNSSSYGGAGLLINDEYAHPYSSFVISNTICNNKSAQGFTGSDFYTTSNCMLRNNIIFNVSDTIHSIAWNNWITPDIDFNSINQKGLDNIGINNIFNDPLFSDPTSFSGAVTGNIENTDWSLTGISSCINTGDTTLYPYISSSDFAGYPRITHNRIDIGAYEYQGSLSIHEINDPCMVDVYPNPTKGNLNIRVDNNNPAHFFLYDIFSRTILRLHFIRTITINMQQFERGIYFYELKDPKGSRHTGKIIRE